MNKLDKQYTDLLKDILENGTTKSDRTGTGTISVFGRQLRHDFRDGFPLLTTKRMAFKQIVTELIWFLRGDTSIEYLLENDCNIWTGDAYQSYLRECEKLKKDLHPEGRPYTKEEFVEKIKTDKKFAGRFGNLGKIYGHQWRNWNDGIDQISELIKQLKENPDSRRLLLSAWNPSDLPHQVLPPCHYGFQVYTRELSDKERVSIFMENKRTNKFEDNNCDIPKRAISLMWNQRSVDTFLGLPFNIASYGLLLEIIAKAVNMVPDELIGNLGDVHLYSNHIEQAKEQIGRDYSVGERLEFLSEKKPDFDPETAFGIAKHIDSYCHYVIDDYSIPRRTREPYPLPKLNINSGNENWYLLDIDDIVNSLDVDLTFKLKNYQHHQTIKAPLSN